MKRDDDDHLAQARSLLTNAQRASIEDHRGLLTRIKNAQDMLETIEALGPDILAMRMAAEKHAARSARKVNVNHIYHALLKDAGYPLSGKKNDPAGQFLTAVKYGFEHLDLLKAALARMTDVQRTRMGSVYSARMLIKAEKDRLAVEAEKAAALEAGRDYIPPAKPPSPVRAIHEKLKAAQHQIAHLDEQLKAADVGGHIDLDRSLAQCIDGVVWHAHTKKNGLERAMRFARDLTARLKQEIAKQKQQATTEGKQ